jgi:cytochrome c
MVCSMAACNNSTPENPPVVPTEAPKDNTATTPPDQPEGMTLMTKSDCGGCHNATAKVVGPSYKDIAAKYPNTPENVSKLADEIIKGSSGVWSSVPMTAHASLQKGDAEKMVTYILGMK